MEQEESNIRTAANMLQGNTFPETQVIVQNGSETQLRVTLNNDTRGVVEVEFHELYETPFRYPFSIYN